MRVAAAIIALLFSLSADAWVRGTYGVAAVNCPIYDSTALTVGSAVVISDCHINAGPASTVFVSITGEVTCGSLSDSTLNIAAGILARPSRGANFNGSIAGGVLTVTGMITPSQFTIDSGTNLYDTTSGAGIPTGINGSTLTVVNQLTGNPGGVGTYTVSDNSVVVSAEAIWSLSTTPDPQSHPENSIQIARDPLEHLACQNGKSYVVTMAAALRNVDSNFTPLNWWFTLLLTSESLSGHNPQSTSFKNGQMTLVAPR